MDDKQILEYERKMLNFPRAMRYAQRNTINDMAFNTKEVGQENMRNDMVLRNQWSERSVQVDRARTINDAAVVGSTLDYMADQEFGGTNVRNGSKGVPIPTATATGEGSAQPRRKTARPMNRLNRLKVNSSKRVGANRKQRNVMAVRQAVKTGRRVVYMDTGKKKFIARITGGKRNPKVRMLYDLSKRSTPIPRQPWLAPATTSTLARGFQMWGRRLDQQLKTLKFK